MPPSSSGNNSGQGSQSTLPPELKGWSWGAFYLSWIWGLGNRSYIPLISLALFFIGFLFKSPDMGFMLFMFQTALNIFFGRNGREWAWQNKRWASVEAFKKAQHRWAVGGLIVNIVLWLMIFFCFNALDNSLDKGVSVRLGFALQTPS